jgi:pimeloyl-ACP methyl ester carboxylesterase
MAGLEPAIHFRRALTASRAPGSQYRALKVLSHHPNFNTVWAKGLVMKRAKQLFLLLFLFLIGLQSGLAGEPVDRSPHKARFIAVEPGVKLEVLDWGGQGQALIFLAGLGDTAHAFDEFAPKFIETHHVLGITRRGFGASSHPTPTPVAYGADRLGDDVLAVIAALKLDHPVLVGHSIAGEELSSVANRHPEKVGGLIYLDAAYPYAFYNPKAGDLVLDSNDLRRTLEHGLRRPKLSEYRALLKTLMQHDLPQLSKDAQNMLDRVEGQPDVPSPPSDAMETGDAVILGEQKYATIRNVPMLAIFAQPHACKPYCDRADAKAQEAWVSAQVNFVAASNPAARIVRLPYADHEVFRSNELEVEREMNAFIRGLPQSRTH